MVVSTRANVLNKGVATLGFHTTLRTFRILQYYSLEVQDLFLCHYIELLSHSIVYDPHSSTNSLVHSLCSTLDISSDLRVFVFQCISQSKSNVLFDEIFVK